MLRDKKIENYELKIDRLIRKIIKRQQDSLITKPKSEKMYVDIIE